MKPLLIILIFLGIIAYSLIYYSHKLPDSLVKPLKTEKEVIDPNPPLPDKSVKAPLPGQSLKSFSQDNNLSKDRKPWKPKPKKDLARAYAGNGFDITTKLECNKCEKACWKTKQDRGGVTCLGFAMTDNSDLLAHILSRQFKNCHKQGIIFDKDDPFGKKKDVCYYLRKAYWERYFAKYKECSYPALIWLGDTAVLQGHRATAKILQRTAGIKVDGKWGPESIKACQNLDLSKYSAERVKVLQSYRDFDKFGKGWLRRVETLKKEILVK